ncbi:MAG: hypothetical protein HWE16_05580 [Gammaproteobacteria bacterium]|nr:hypothetical protein [Gammaproteobacteria bacterium]
MLLRRITQHIKDQNWFAVFIDFLIVVVGVFIGIQVANWNDALSKKAQEKAIIEQLDDEFTEIENALNKQIKVRKGYIDDLGLFVAAIENNDISTDDKVIKRAIHASRSTGRLPVKSAAFLQLRSSGQLARLSSNELQKALTSYHSLLERDGYIFDLLIELVNEQWTANPYVDYNANANKRSLGASVDMAVIDKDGSHLNTIRSYDFEGLRQFETKYETILQLHKFLLNTDEKQLMNVNKIRTIILQRKH